MIEEVLFKKCKTKGKGGGSPLKIRSLKDRRGGVTPNIMKIRK